MTATVSSQTADRLQRTIETIVDPGIVGITVRFNDEQGGWVGSAGADAGGLSRAACVSAECGLVHRYAVSA